MHTLKNLILICLLPVVAMAQRGSSYQPNQKEFFEEVDPPTPQDAIKLSREVVQTLYVSAGYVTHLEFATRMKIRSVAVGAEKLVRVEVDPRGNAIILTPMVANGHTNMTIVFDKTPYVWEITIRNAGEINYRMTYSLPATDGQARLPFGPAMSPQSVPVSEIMRKISQYGHTPLSPKDARNIFYQPVNKPYTWNDNIITLSDAFCFTRENLIVLRVHRRNLSGGATYLAADQIIPYVANTPFPSTVRFQSSAQLFPQQAEMIYLFIQGYNLTADNDFALQLPPDSKAVEQYLRAR